jgi:hypothetical protein
MQKSDNGHGIKSSAKEDYQITRLRLAKALRTSIIPDNELLGNLGIFIERMHLSRIMLMHELYKLIIDVPGIIIEFGVRWGQNICLFNSFRGMHEPYNYTRKVVGFDTFEGFSEIDPKDLKDTNILSPGDYSVTGNYKETLEKILEDHEMLSPLDHIKKTELVAGDASVTFPNYLEKNPETIVALAYFDFDLYRPTKDCLQNLLSRLVKGSVIVFDELNCPSFPGETIAVQEVLGLNNIRLKRDTNNPYVSWCIFE